MPATIDLLSARSFAAGQPFEQFAWLRQHDPVYRHPEPDGPGFWAVTSYADVRSVSRDPATFSSRGTVLIDDRTTIDLGDHEMMLMQDPPAHTGFRRFVVPDFIPRAAKAMRPRIAELASSIIDGVIERGECDLVGDVAGLLPSYVVAEMLGIPHADGVDLYRLTETIHSAPDPLAPGAHAAAGQAMMSYAHDLWQARRAQPGDDLATKLAYGHVDGRDLDELDFSLFFMLIIDAGGDTTRNLVAGGMQALFEHPDQLAALRAHLDGLPRAIEELLRWVSPVVYMRRTAIVDTELAGRPISAGDKVVMYYGSANRDPAVFAEPDRLDIARHPNDHVAFGAGGPHFCMGAHIGRIEIAAMLEQILTRLPDIEPRGPVEWQASIFISGPKHLPVQFSPGPRHAVE